MKTLRQDIKEKSFRSVYLLYGEETYLVNQYKKRLREEIVGEDTFNYSYFEGKGIALEKVADITQTMPFFADKRMLLIENSGLFKGASQQGWVQLVASIPEGCHIVFAEREIDKKGRLYKTVHEKGLCVEMKRQTEEDLEKWVVGMLTRQNLRITRGALDLFLMKTGTDMENIKMELEKLISYCQGEEGISTAAVEAICTERLTNRVFEMIQSIAEGNPQKALELYYDLVALKEPGMLILFRIAKHMNQLMCIREMSAAGASRDSIAAALGLKPFIVGKLLGQVKHFTKLQLQSCVEQCVSLEEAIKSGRMTEKIAVEMVILSIVNRVQI